MIKRGIFAKITYFNRDKAQVNITAVPSLKLPELDRRERNYLIQVINVRFSDFFSWDSMFSFTSQLNSFSYEWLRIWPRFDEKALNNSKLSHFSQLCVLIIYFEYTNLDISLSFSIITSKIQPHHTRPPHFIYFPCSVICHRNQINITPNYGLGKNSTDDLPLCLLCPSITDLLTICASKWRQHDSSSLQKTEERQYLYTEWWPKRLR